MKGPAIALILVALALVGVLVFWFVKTRQTTILAPAAATPSVTGGVVGLMDAGATNAVNGTNAVLKVLTTPVDVVRKLFHI